MRRLNVGASINEELFPKDQFCLTDLLLSFGALAHIIPCPGDPFRDMGYVSTVYFL